ncbi:hypothetical protein ACP70R_047107 [Stipagrostis hirtigluma subsp. patula]
METPPAARRKRRLILRHCRLPLASLTAQVPAAGVSNNHQDGDGSAKNSAGIIDLTVDSPDDKVPLPKQEGKADELEQATGMKQEPGHNAVPAEYHGHADTTEANKKHALQQTVAGSHLKLEAGPSNSNDKRACRPVNPKVNNAVYISRRTMLRDVMHQLNLSVLHSGTDPYGYDLHQAWMHVQIPKIYKRDPVRDTTIYGDPSATAAGAKENAANAVLDYYCSTKDVRINDWNRHELMKKDDILHGANFWTEAFKEKIEDLTHAAAVQNTEFTGMVRSIAAICDGFSDVLPLQKVDQHEPNDSHLGTGFTYSGSTTNPSRIDQLAMALLDLLAAGVAQQAKRGVSIACNHQDCSR